MVVWQRLDKLVQMCGSVDGVYLALIGDGAMGPVLSERHGFWSNSGKRRTKVQYGERVLPPVSLRANLGYKSTVQYQHRQRCPIQDMRCCGALVLFDLSNHISR